MSAPASSAKIAPARKSPRERIAERAAVLGFEALGVADARAPWPAGERLAAFVEEGRHGDMAWMAETLERRAHPTAMWPQAKTAIVVGMNYGPDHDPRSLQGERGVGALSVYAQGEDYHQLLKGRLKTLAGFVAARFGCEVKVFVDTAPLMEKPLAERAGLGWQGKHTNLVSRTHGSWLFLGVILATLELAPDPGGRDSCGSCRACLDACPTGAFPAPYQIDARRCLSYLTIEHAGAWPAEFRRAAGNRIYGCDDCLAACPWNKWASEAAEIGFHARDDLRAPRLGELAGLDDASFRLRFRRSPVKRIGRDRFVRNVLYAIGNSGDPALIEAARALLDDPAPVVADAARWALAELEGRPGEFLPLASLVEEPPPCSSSPSM